MRTAIHLRYGTQTSVSTQRRLSPWLIAVLYSAPTLYQAAGNSSPTTNRQGSTYAASVAATFRTPPRHQPRRRHALPDAEADRPTAPSMQRQTATNTEDDRRVMLDDAPSATCWAARWRLGHISAMLCQHWDWLPLAAAAVLRASRQMNLAQVSDG